MLTPAENADVSDIIITPNCSYYDKVYSYQISARNYLINMVFREGSNILHIGHVTDRPRLFLVRVATNNVYLYNVLFFGAQYVLVVGGRRKHDICETTIDLGTYF